MANLKEVKGRINSVISTQQITKAMKMVAAAKLRKAQDNIIRLRPYSKKLLEVMENVASLAEESVDSKYGEHREIKTVLLVPITSDRGLCGAFNNNIAKATQAAARKEQDMGHAVKLLPIGKKGFDFFRKRELEFISDYSQLFADVSFDHVKTAAEFAMNGFLKGEWDKVLLVFNEFKNVATQIVQTEQFLPLMEEELEEDAAPREIEFLFEPSKSEILEQLIPKSLKIQFFKAILESNAAEHGARMTAMDQATENAAELLKELRITYNRTRQAAITKEINEIVAGADALG